MKHLRKLMALLLVLTLVLTGCAGGNDVPEKETPEVEEGDKEADKDGDKEAGKDMADMKIAAIVNGNLGDKSFFDSLKEGLDTLETDKGVTTKVIETGFDETKWEPALIDAAEGEWDIIIAGTWQMADYVRKVASEYPEKKFIVFDTTVEFEEGVTDNIYTIEYKQNEGSYLAGAVAAKISGSDKLGFVGGMDIPVINDFLVGYIDGAQYVNPDIKVATSYIGNFSDTGKAKELAFAQAGLGVDIVFPCASIAGNGALEGAKEKKIQAVGVDSDQSLLYKEANDEDMANLILTSVLKEVGNSIIRAIELESKGELAWGTGEQLGIKEGAIGIAKNEYYEENVPAEVQELVNEIETKIKDGDIVVKTAFGLSADELNDIRNTVKP